MSRHRGLAGIGLLLVMALSALAVLPARWLMLALPPDIPIAIADTTGTVWSGSATLALGRGQNRRILPDPLRWNLSFADGPRLDLHHAWLRGPVTLAVTLDGVKLSGQTLALPARALAAVDPAIATIGPGGMLTVSWPAITLFPSARPGGQPLLNAEWRDASSALTPVRPLGDYVLVSRQGTDGRADFLIETRRGPLLLEGRGHIDASTGLHFRGTARADPSAPAEIQTALQDILGALGPRQNQQTLLNYR